MAPRAGKRIRRYRKDVELPIIAPESPLAAWGAGLYEGEGSLSLTSRGSTPVIALSMTDKDVVERFSQAFGGRLYQVAKVKVHYKDVWRCTIIGWERVGWFYDVVGKWLGGRRRARFTEILAMEPEFAPASPPCGIDPNRPSQNGYARHLRNKENPCADCRQAKAAYMYEWRHNKKGAP